jgi:hypothetical protein
MRVSDKKKNLSLASQNQAKPCKIRRQRGSIAACAVSRPLQPKTQGLSSEGMAAGAPGAPPVATAPSAA